MHAESGVNVLLSSTEEAVTIEFDGCSTEWNRKICDPREIREQWLSEKKTLESFTQR